jgi:16S rRNA processing protein RimM
VLLEGVEDRDAAVKLRGSVLYVRDEQVQAEKSDQAEEGEEEYLVSDLVGLEVFLQATSDSEDDPKQFVGTVGGVVFAEDLSTVPGGAGYDYLELVLPRGGTEGMASFRDELVLIPLVPQIVTRVDLDAREVYVDPPHGLLDLTYVRKDKMRIKGFLPSSE